MALTSAQRRRLPSSAFVYPRQRKYPVPTKAQARRAGISEAQRLRIHRNALSRANQRRTSGSYPTVARKVKARAGAKVKTVGGRRGTVSRPGYRRGGTRRGRGGRARGRAGSTRGRR
jgi:hypothetical protein